MKSNRVSIGLAFVLAGVFLYLAVRGVDWHEVGRTMKAARGEALAIGCVFASAAILLRAIRWSILLRQDKQVSTSLVFWATSVGYLGNHFLPARVGELMRTAAMAWGAGLSKAWVLATALTERSLDAAVLALISSAALLTINELPIWVLRAAQVMAFASAGGIAVIFVLPRFEEVIQLALRVLPVPAHVRMRLGKLMAHFLRGMRVFNDVGRLVRFVALTAVVWVVDALAALAVSEALSLQLSFVQLLLLIAALGLASALPSTPGFVGVYQFVAVSVLGPFGISQSNSLAYIFLLQAVISSSVLLWGLLGVWQLRSVRASFPAPATASQAG